MTLCKTEIMDVNSWNILWSISFGVLGFLILVGNLVTIVIFSKPKLRNRLHFLLINLSLADLMVGLVSIPIFVTLHNNNMTRLLLLLFDSADMLAGLASVFILAVISLERMHAVGWLLRHRFLSSQAYIFAIVTPWCLAAVVTLSRLLLYYSIIARHHFVVIVIISLTTPLVVTISCYFFIWKALKSRLLNPHRNVNDDKLAKTLLMVIGAFIITWLPFEILVVVINLCPPCQQIPVILVYIIKLLHFSNSVINVIIYPLRIPTFREALLRILNVRSCFRSRYEINQLNSGISVLSMTKIVEPLSSLGIYAAELVTSLQLQTLYINRYTMFDCRERVSL